MRKMLTVLVAGLVAFATANAQNLVPNGNFESWDDPNTPTGWTYESGVTFDQESGTVYQGTYSAKVTLTTQNQGNTDTESDFFAVTAGQDYEFSFWVLDNDPAGNARLVVRWYDASQSYLSANYGAYSSDDPNWQKVSGTYTAPSNAAYAKFCFRFYDVSGNWDGDAVFYIDSVVAVPATPTIYEVTIEEIQGTGDTSPYEGEKVKTSGNVTAVFAHGFFLEMNPGGARRGIYVYTGSTPTVSVGDTVVIEQADVQEYNGLTELTNPTITVVGNNYPVPVTTITLANFNEDYEGVFVKVENVWVADPDLGYGEWLLSDGSNTGRVDDMGSYTYVPTLDDYLAFVQGPLTYTYGNYKLEPRDDADISVTNYAPDTAGHSEAAEPGHGVIVSFTWNDPDGNIVDDSLYYRVDGGIWQAVDHDSITNVTRGGGTYWYTIPPQTSGNTLEYYGIAIDDQGSRNVTDTYTTTPVAVAEAGAGSALRVALRSAVVRNHLEVAFSLPRTGEVSVALYNAAGQRVQTLWHGTLPAGEHVQRMPVSLNAGVYFLAAKVDGRTVATHRLVIVR